MINQVFEIPTHESIIGSKYNEEIKEPNNVPHELSHVLTFNEYKNIVLSCKEQIETKSRYRIVLIIPIIIVSIVFGILFATHVTSHTFLIIGFVSFLVLYFIVSIYLFSRWSNKFNDKLDELNHLYSCKGIRIEKKTHYSHNKRSKSTTKIYIYYTAPFNSSQIGIVVPPPPMYIINNQQQQQQQQFNYNQNQYIQPPTQQYDMIYDNNNDTMINYNISIDTQPLIKQQQKKLNEKTPLIK